MDILGQRPIRVKKTCNYLLQAHGSGWLVGAKLTLNSCDDVPQGQSTLFQPADHQLVDRRISRGAVYQSIEVSMFDSQFNQLALGGMKIC
jgi:hypothetical protein